MFEIFKKIFKKETKESIIKVSIDKIENWLNERLGELEKQAEPNLKEMKQHLSDELTHLKQRILNLEKAELMNPDIPERAKHYMEGNRSAYIKKLNVLVENTKIPNDVKSFMAFSEDFDKRFKDFINSTIRPYQILNEFFANEVKGILRNMKNIQISINSTKEKINFPKISKIDFLKKEAASLLSQIQQKHFFEEQLTEKQKILDEIKPSILKLKSEIEILEKNETLLELDSDLNKIQDKCHKIELRLAESFSVLETALKKFSRLTFQHKLLIEKCLRSPIKTLTEDKDFEIPEMLSSLKGFILNKRIDLKDKKREKTIAEINLLSKEAIQEIVDEYTDLKKQESQLVSGLNSLEAAGKLKLLKEQLEKYNTRLVSVKNDLDHIKKHLEKRETSELKEEFVHKVKNTLDINLQLI